MPQITLNPVFYSINLAYGAWVLIHYTQIHSTSCMEFSSLYCCFPECNIYHSIIMMNVCLLFISFLIPSFHLFALVVVAIYHILIYFSISPFFNVDNSIIITELFQYSVCEFSLAFHKITCPSLRASFQRHGLVCS